jgi:hypothetical protein
MRLSHFLCSAVPFWQPVDVDDQAEDRLRRRVDDRSGGSVELFHDWFLFALFGAG